MTTPWPPPPGPRPARLPGTFTRAELCQLCGERPAVRPTNGCARCLEAQATARPLQVIRPAPLRPRRVWRDFDSAAARWAAPWWALTWLLTLGKAGRLPWTWETPTVEEAQEEAEAERERFHGCSCGRVCAGSPAVRGRRITAWKACPAPLCSRLVWANGPGELRSANLGTR